MVFLAMSSLAATYSSNHLNASALPIWVRIGTVQETWLFGYPETDVPVEYVPTLFRQPGRLRLPAS